MRPTPTHFPTSRPHNNSRLQVYRKLRQANSSTSLKSRMTTKRTMKMMSTRKLNKFWTRKKVSKSSSRPASSPVTLKDTRTRTNANLKVTNRQSSSRERQALPLFLETAVTNSCTPRKNCTDQKCTHKVHTDSSTQVSCTSPRTHPSFRPNSLSWTSSKRWTNVNNWTSWRNNATNNCARLSNKSKLRLFCNRNLTFNRPECKLTPPKTTGGKPLKIFITTNNNTPPKMSSSHPSPPATTSTSHRNTSQSKTTPIISTNVGTSWN